MLVEISCNQFHGGPIRFYDGLNVVRGNTGGIGKSMFLMILDFAFGGSDYIPYAQKAVTPFIKSEQEFRFTFEFDGEPLYFTRGTANSSFVIQHSKDFKSIIKKRAVRDYQTLLAERYRINLGDDVSFRDFSKHFYRIYRRDNCFERRPLTFKTDGDASSIEFLMRLFNQYEAFEKLKAVMDNPNYKSLAAKRKEFRDTNIHGRIDQLKKENAEMALRRETLTSEAEDLEFRFIGVEASDGEKIMTGQQELRLLTRQRRQLAAQLQAINSNRDNYNEAPMADFSALQRFFPDANIQTLGAIEQFHSKIAEILAAEIQQELERLRPAIQRMDTEISRLQQEIRASGDVRQEMMSRMAQYHKTSNTIDENEKELERLRTLLEEQERLAKLERAIISLKEQKAAAIAEVGRKINSAMDEFNGRVTQGHKQAPALNITNTDQDGLSYSLETPDDTSEKTSYKNLVLYDLAILALTPLPVLMHDSNITKRIEDNEFEEILRLYQESGRQIFIAVDKLSTPTAEEMLNAAEILSLSKGGGELFGRSWSWTEKAPKESPAEATEETTDE